MRYLVLISPVFLSAALLLGAGLRGFAEPPALEPRIALIMGVGDYDGTRFPRLPGIDMDFERMVQKVNSDQNGIVRIPKPISKTTPRETYVVFQFAGDEENRPCEARFKIK